MGSAVPVALRGHVLACLDLSGRTTFAIDFFLCFVITTFRLDISLGPAQVD